MPESRRLKVLFMTAWYPSPEIPVEGTFIKEHARAVNLYDDVAVLHLAGYDASIRGLYEIQPVHEEDLPTWRVKYRRPFPKTSYLAYLWSAVAAYLHIRRQGFSPHIIHAHISSCACPALFIGRCFGKPVVVTEQFTDAAGCIFSKGLWDQLSKFALRRANLIVAVSQDLKRKLKQYGINGQFTVIPNTVDMRQFSSERVCINKTKERSTTGEKRILFVGSLEQRKGIIDLLRAIKKVSSQRQDVHLDVVGSGPMRTECKELIKSMNLTDIVSFHGYQPHGKLAHFINSCDFFVLPSIQETFGVVLIEAMACGKPVIATPCGGPEEFVTGEVGMLVPPKDVDALANAITQMLDRFKEFNPSTITEYARERFSHEAVGGSLHSIYDHLVPYAFGCSG